MEKGDLQQAQAAYQNAIKAFPNFKRAYKNLGVSMLREEKYPEALPYFIKAIELGENGGDTYGLLGYCYLSVEKFESALEAYRMATLLDGGNMDWRIGKIQALMETKRYEEAIAMLGEVLQQAPDRQALWITRANAFLESDKPQEAAIQLEILRRLGNSNVNSLILLGDIYMNDNLPALALIAYKDALDMDAGKKPELAVRVAKTLASRAAFKEASEYVDLVSEQYRGTTLDNSTKLDLLNIEAEIAMGLDELEKAATILKRIVDEDPVNARALRLLGNYYYSQQEHEEAEFYLTRLSKLDGYEAEAFIQLARIKVALSELPAAVTYLEEALLLRSDPNVSRYLEAVRRAAEASSF
jgi:tetratricopeptide (TPR) repeat protein